MENQLGLTPGSPNVDQNFRAHCKALTSRSLELCKPEFTGEIDATAANVLLPLFLLLQFGDFVVQLANQIRQFLAVAVSEVGGDG